MSEGAVVEERCHLRTALDRIEDLLYGRICLCDPLDTNAVLNLRLLKPGETPLASWIESEMERKIEAWRREVECVRSELLAEMEERQRIKSDKRQLLLRQATCEEVIAKGREAGSFVKLEVSSA